MSTEVRRFRHVWVMLAATIGLSTGLSAVGGYSHAVAASPLDVSPGNGEPPNSTPPPDLFDPNAAYCTSPTTLPDGHVVYTSTACAPNSPAYPNNDPSVNPYDTYKAIAPGPPTITRVTIDSFSDNPRLNGAEVDFTDSYDGGSPIGDWTVTAEPGGETAHGFGANEPGVKCADNPDTCNNWDFFHIGSWAEVTGLQSGQTYTFTVVANNYAGDSPASPPSAPFTYGSTPVSPNLSLSATNVVAGHTLIATVTGQPNTPTTMYGYQAPSTTLEEFFSARSNSNGVATFKIAPDTNLTLQGRQGGQSTHSLHVTVSQDVLLKFTKEVKRAYLAEGYDTGPTVKIRYRKLGTKTWHTFKTLTVQDNQYATSVTFKKAGSYQVRAFTPATSVNAAGASAIKNVTVR